MRFFKNNFQSAFWRYSCLEVQLIVYFQTEDQGFPCARCRTACTLWSQQREFGLGTIKPSHLQKFHILLPPSILSMHLNLLTYQDTMCTLGVSSTELFLAHVQLKKPILCLVKTDLRFTWNQEITCGQQERKSFCEAMLALVSLVVLFHKIHSALVLLSFVPLSSFYLSM